MRPFGCPSRKRVDLCADQHQRAANEGRQVGVIVGCKEGGAWFPGTTWKATYTTEVFRAALVSRQEVAKTILNYMEGRT